MNEKDSWKLQDKMLKARWKDVWWYSPLSREWQIHKEEIDIDVDPPDEYNRVIEGDDS